MRHLFFVDWTPEVKPLLVSRSRSGFGDGRSDARPAPHALSCHARHRATTLYTQSHDRQTDTLCSHTLKYALCSTRPRLRSARRHQPGPHVLAVGASSVRDSRAHVSARWTRVCRCTSHHPLVLRGRRHAGAQQNTTSSMERLPGEHLSDSCREQVVSLAATSTDRRPEEPNETVD